MQRGKWCVTIVQIFPTPGVPETSNSIAPMTMSVQTSRLQKTVKYIIHLYKFLHVSHFNNIFSGVQMAVSWWTMTAQKLSSATAFCIQTEAKALNVQKGPELLLTSTRWSKKFKAMCLKKCLRSVYLFCAGGRASSMMDNALVLADSSLDVPRKFQKILSPLTQPQTRMEPASVQANSSVMMTAVRVSSAPKRNLSKTRGCNGFAVRTR